MRTPKELGEEIARLRHEQKLTQRALAERLHVTDKAVSRWERGLGYPDFQLLDSLCRALDVPAEQLLFGKTQAEQKAPGDEIGTAPEAAEAGQHESLAAVYADAEKAYRSRLRRRRLVAAGVLALLLGAFLLYRAILQPRVRQSLSGTYTPPNGAPVAVQVELEGRLYSFLLRDRLYYGGTVSIREEDGGALLFSRRFVARDHAEGMDAIGLLHDFEDALHCSAFVYRPEQNEFGTLDFWLSPDCAKLWIARNDALPGELLAAADPDVDVTRFRERCLIHMPEQSP